MNIWISVKDRLPEHMQNVRAKASDVVIEKAWYIVPGRSMFMIGFTQNKGHFPEQINGVTEWMPSTSPKESE